MMLKDTIKFVNKYLFYYMKSDPIQISFQLTKQAGAQDAINQEFMNSLFVPIPPLPEQKAIAAFLDRETARIDGLVEKVERSVSMLKEYRAALISAAVTGKIDVRGEVQAK